MKKYYIKKSLYENKYILWCEVEDVRSFAHFNIHEERTRRDLLKYVKENKITLNRWIK